MKIWMQKITGKEKEFISKCYKKAEDISYHETIKIKKLVQKCDQICNQANHIKSLCELTLLYVQ